MDQYNNFRTWYQNDRIDGRVFDDENISFPLIRRYELPLSLGLLCVYTVLEYFRYSRGEFINLISYSDNNIKQTISYYLIFYDYKMNISDVITLFELVKKRKIKSSAIIDDKIYIESKYLYIYNNPSNKTNITMIYDVASAFITNNGTNNIFKKVIIGPYKNKITKWISINTSDNIIKTNIYLHNHNGFTKTIMNIDRNKNTLILSYFTFNIRQDFNVGIFVQLIERFNTSIHNLHNIVNLLNDYKWYIVLDRYRTFISNTILVKYYNTVISVCIDKNIIIDEFGDNMYNVVEMHNIVNRCIDDGYIDDIPYDIKLYLMNTIDQHY